MYGLAKHIQEDLLDPALVTLDPEIFVQEFYHELLALQMLTQDI